MKAVFILFALISFALAQSPAPPPLAPYTLTPDEAKAWAAFDTDEATNARALNDAVTRAINTAVGFASPEVHGAISQAGLALELVRTRRAAFLAQLQARQKCPGCVIQDGKLMPEPAPPKK